MSYVQKVEATADRGGAIFTRLVERQNELTRSPNAGVLVTLPLIVAFGLLVGVALVVTWPLAWCIDYLRERWS